jgi:hypothetical protein
VPLTIAEHLGISPETLRKLGTFNIKIDEDNLYYIDPRLLEKAKTAEFVGAYADVDDYFEALLVLVGKSKTKGDALWRAAESHLRFREAEGLCLGYTRDGTGGSGIGKKIGDKVLGSAQEFISAGHEDPRVLEFLIVLETGVGADRISDMFANILYPRLLAYTERILATLRVQTEPMDIADRTYQLIKNPKNGTPVVLAPAEILADLPTAQGRSDVDDICSHNDALRSHFNRRLGKDWKKKMSKAIFKAHLLADKDLLRSALATFRDIGPVAYDFGKDPAGIQRWRDDAIQFGLDNPVNLTVPAEPRDEDIQAAAIKICAAFKQAVENQGGSKLLRTDEGGARGEVYSQNLFYQIARVYCSANKLDISPETDAGRGELDFKISRGTARAALEFKVSSNEKLIHGFTTQLREYMKAENASCGVYVVVDFGEHERPVKELVDLVESYRFRGDNSVQLVLIDARKKKSASKA